MIEMPTEGLEQLINRYSAPDYLPTTGDRLRLRWFKKELARRLNNV